MKVCPTCNQPLPDVRLGVEMTALKARMFDLIKSSGENGCPAHRLNEEIWEGHATPSNIKSHIFQLNEMLEETGYKVVQTIPRYGYRLKKTEKRK